MNQCRSYCRLIKRMCNSKTPLLPEEYQQVEYLQSSGTQYIRSGIYNCDSLDVKFQVVQYTGSTLFIGAKSSTSNEKNRIGVGELYWNSKRLFVFTVDGSTPSSPEDTNVHSVQMGRVFDWKIYFDDKYKATFPNQNVTTYETYLFRSQVDSALAKCRIYYAKIYANSTLVRDFYPCYRKSDNKPGMYDLVSRAFFTNNGSGEFTLGSNV